MSFSYVLGKMLSLAIMMMLGFAAHKGHILSAKTNEDLSKLAVDITTPAMMLASLSATKATRSDLLIIVAAGAVICGVLIAAAELITRFFPCSQKERPVYKYFLVFTNNAFMGLPVVLMLWGEKALLYASLLNIPISILMFSYGMWQYARAGSDDPSFSLRKIINIPIISAVLVLVLAMFSFKFTGVLQDTFQLIGDATVPLSMIIIGSTLAEKPVKGIFENRFLYLFALIRLMIVPAVILGILYFLPINPLIKGVLVIITAMPGSATGVMFAQMYSVNRTISSRYVFISTVLSVITIPVMSVIILSPLGI